MQNATNCVDLTRLRTSAGFQGKRDVVIELYDEETERVVVVAVAPGGARVIHDGFEPGGERRGLGDADAIRRGVTRPRARAIETLPRLHSFYILYHRAQRTSGVLEGLVRM